MRKLAMAAALSEIFLKNSLSSYGAVITRPIVAAARLSTDSANRAPASSEKGPSLYDSSLAGMKRGTGGRSSFNGVVATVFGATGFVGRYVCNRLGKTGTQIIIPYRGEHYFVLPLKLVGDLGQVLFMPYDIRDEESIRKAMKYSNVVINLVGRDWETRNFSFKDVHVDGPRRIARLAKECGVKRLIHFSSLNCSPNPKGVILEDGSKFLRSRYEGEVAVKEEFPDVTIFRPSDIFGQEDRFLQYYAHAWRRSLQWLPLWDRGENTLKQPVFVGDVAQGVVNAIKDPESAGKTYDLVGPDRYKLSDLADWFFKAMRRNEAWGYRRTNLKYSPLFQLRITLTERFCPSYPVGWLTWDKIERDHVTDETSTGLTLEDLGVSLTTLESRIEWELKPNRAYSYYNPKHGEFPTPDPPNPIITKKSTPIRVA